MSGRPGAAPPASSFAFSVYEAVRAIPTGKVIPYGQLAVLIGAAGRARQVGHAMARAPEDPTLPCHRVVAAGGRLVPGWPEQRALLEAEGVTFTPGGVVRMKAHLWRPFG